MSHTSYLLIKNLCVVCPMLFGLPIALDLFIPMDISGITLDELISPRYFALARLSALFLLLPLGALLDSHGRRGIAITALGLLVISSLGFLYADTIITALLMHALQTFAAGACFMAGIAMLYDQFKGETALKFIALSLGVALGLPFILSSILDTLSLQATWREITWVIAILSAGQLLSFTLASHETFRQMRRHSWRHGFGHTREILNQSQSLLALIIAVFALSYLVLILLTYPIITDKLPIDNLQLFTSYRLFFGLSITWASCIAIWLIIKQGGYRSLAVSLSCVFFSSLLIIISTLGPRLQLITLMIGATVLLVSLSMTLIAALFRFLTLTHQHPGTAVAILAVAMLMGLFTVLLYSQQWLGIPLLAIAVPIFFISTLLLLFLNAQAYSIIPPVQFSRA